MNIIVVGCGKIGTTIIKDLVNEGHNITIVDNNEAILSGIADIYDVMSICGNGADTETLEESGAGDAQLLIATTDSDELNMLCCFLAKKMGTQHTIARIRNPEYNDDSLGFMKQHLNIDMAINPEKLAAGELYNILKMPTASKIESFSRRNFEMVEFIIPKNSPLDGVSLIKLREKFKANYLIGSVLRHGKVYIPDGNFVLEAGDRIGVTASAEEFDKLLKMVGSKKKQAKSVMILGGSKTAYYLAQKLDYMGNHVKIIEIDKARAEHLSKSFSRAVIICANGAQQEVLLEEGLNSTDAFIALTGMDEENILISVFAQKQAVPTVISKVNSPELEGLASSLGLDSLVSPRKIASDVVVRFARALDNSYGNNVETLYKIMDSQAEALEFKAKPDLPFIGIKFRELNLKPNILIGGIIRNRVPIIPSGDDCILAEDRVIVLCAGRRLFDLSDILK